MTKYQNLKKTLAMYNKLWYTISILVFLSCVICMYGMCAIALIAYLYGMCNVWDGLEGFRALFGGWCVGFGPPFRGQGGPMPTACTRIYYIWVPPQAQFEFNKCFTIVKGYRCDYG